MATNNAYNIDITVSAANGANPGELEDEIKKRLPDEIIEEVLMVSKIEAVELESEEQ